MSSQFSPILKPQADQSGPTLTQQDDQFSPMLTQQASQFSPMLTQQDYYDLQQAKFLNGEAPPPTPVCKRELPYKSSNTLDQGNNTVKPVFEPLRPSKPGFTPLGSSN